MFNVSTKYKVSIIGHSKDIEGVPKLEPPLYLWNDLGFGAPGGRK